MITYIYTLQIETTLMLENFHFFNIEQTPENNLAIRVETPSESLTKLPPASL